MIEFVEEVLAIALALPLLVMTIHLVYVFRRWLISHATVRCVAHISAMLVAEEEPSDKEIRSLRIRFTKGIIHDAVNFISEYIYGRSLNRLSLIVEVCAVDYTPIFYRRFGEIATLIEAYPDHAIRYISRLDYPLSWYDVALLSQLMRRAGTPIAYTPLLISQNRNLQLIGLYLCEHFSIVDAEPHLQRLAGSEDSEISYIALLSLCSIRGDISTSQVGRALGGLLPYQRAAFLRHAVHACYSLRSCAHLLNKREGRLFLQRINSYKCRIVCN